MAKTNVETGTVTAKCVIAFLNQLQPADLRQLITIVGASDYITDKGNLRESVAALVEWTQKRGGCGLDTLYNEALLYDKPVSHAPDRLWEPPFGRNCYFAGREAELQKLAHTLKSSISAQAISGLGGVGKTQLALEFAFRCQDRENYPDYPNFPFILWCNADTPLNLRSDLDKWSSRLNPVLAQDAEAWQEWIAQWLSKTTDYLLILDNTDEPDTIRKELPSRLAGKLLLTSRASYFRAFQISQPLSLNVMTEAEALELFKKLRLLASGDTEEYEAAKALAEEFGNLPLALSQAAAYCLHRKTSIQTYLQRYRKRPMEILEKESAFTDSYTKTVYYTWRKSIEAVKRKSVVAVEVLRYAAFLAPSPIPEFLFVKGAEDLSDPLMTNLDDEEALEDLLLILADYSLVKRDGSTRTFSVHRLVQQVQRDYLSQKEQAEKVYSEELLACIVRAYPGSDLQYRADCTQLVPHWQLYAKEIKSGNHNNEYGATLLNQYAFYLTDTGLLREALDLHEQAYKVYCHVWGEENPDTLTSLHSLAECLYALGRVGEALTLYEQAFKKWHPVLEENGTTFSKLASILTSFNGMALCLQKLERT